MVLPTILTIVYLLTSFEHSSTKKTLIWLQHPELSDYYDTLLQEKIECQKVHRSFATKLFNRIASIGKKSSKSLQKTSSSQRSDTSSSVSSKLLESPSSLSEALVGSSRHSEAEVSTSSKLLHPGRSEVEVSTSSRLPRTGSSRRSEAGTSSTSNNRLLRTKSSNCQTARSINAKNVLQRAKSFSEIRHSRNESNIDPSEGYRLLRSYTENLTGTDPSHHSSISGAGRTCSLHRASLIKKMERSRKQELCEANLILFSPFEDDFISTGENAANIRPILLRDTYGIKQHFTENLLPKEKNFFTKKKEDSSKHEYVRLSSSPTGMKKKKKKKKEIKDKKEKKKEYAKIRVYVEKEASVAKVKAIPCIVFENRSWFIVDGYGADQYFTVEKYFDEEFYKVTGLLETEAEVGSHPIEVLEKEYRFMQNWIVRSKSRRNLCLLNGIQKFRLCSAVYAAWQRHQEFPVGKFNMTKTIEDDECEEAVLLKSKTEKGRHSPITQIPSILLPCRVPNGGRDFYMIVNETNPDVFIVTSPANNTDYFLHGYVRNIPVLKNTLLSNILVAYTAGGRV